MASRRPVSQLLTSVYRAVEAQLAATSNQLNGPSQLTSLYADVLRPQQFTSLRNFGTTGTPAFDGTISLAEAAASSAAKAAAKGKKGALLQAGNTSVPDAAPDASQLAKLARKPRATKAKSTGALVPEPTGDASHLAKQPKQRRTSTKVIFSKTEPADDTSQLAKLTRKPRTTKAKPATALTTEPADDAMQLAEPSRKPRTIKAKAKPASALVTEPADVTAKPPKTPRSSRAKPTSASAPLDDASQLGKLTRQPRSIKAKPAGRKASSEAAAASAASPKLSGRSDLVSDSDASSEDSLGSSARLRTPVRSIKPSHSLSEQIAVLASPAAVNTGSVTGDRAQTGNEADAELSPTTRSQRSKREATVARSKSSTKQGKVAQAKVVLPSYQQLSEHMAGSGQLLHTPFEERRAIKAHMRAFKGSAHVQDQALALYVNSQLFFRGASELETFICKAATPELVDALMAAEPGPAAEDALFGLFAEYMVHNYSAELQTYRTRVQTVDMRKSHKWYPMARSLQRRIIYHAGPTNSGKTYQALKAMREAKSGVYCGPLRLLAMEVFDSVNQQGVHCNLHTGQERQVLAGAQHVSCTIEMASTTRQWDCAVIDEIQMIGDDQRGWAWTRAVQGLAANEIHLCGDASALPLVKQMCEDMAEPLTVVNYNRFTDLEIQHHALAREYASVEPGDCIVAFSRRDIFDIKADIERRTSHKCCVIYGALPPEMRRHQAELFNEPHNGFDILVASDAVGMGLNLNIRRVIFHKVQKFEGIHSVQVSPSQIKQIAGRAGRRNSLYPKGLVGTRAPADLPAVIEAVKMPLNQLSTPAAGLFPEFQHLELLAGQVPNDSFAQLLNRFSDEAKLEGTFFFCRQDGVMQIAKLLEKVDNLSLEDRFDFCMAPANIRDPRIAAALLHFAARYAHGLPATLDIALPNTPPTTAEELRHVEATHQLMSLWIWLSQRFGPEAFPGLEAVAKQSEDLISLMDRGLERMCAWNKRQGRSRTSAVSGQFGPTSKAALLLQHEPLALAYLSNSRGQKYINSYEWTEPVAELNEMAYGGQR